MGKTVIAGRGLPGKEEELYSLYDDGTFLLRDVRGSYVHAGKLYQGKPDKDTGKVPAPKYTFTAILENGRHERARRLLEREIRKLLKANGFKDDEDIKADFKCLRDGNLSGKSEYRNAWTVNMSERENRPPILRGMKNEKIDRDHMGDAKIDAMFLSGYYFDVLGKLWYQKDYGRKVNCNFLAAKISRKGETFGEGGITDDDADDVFGAGDTGGFDDDDDAGKPSGAAAGDDDL